MRDGHVPIRNGELYFRETGSGTPVVIAHGGPDFDHRYLLPDMDRLGDTYRLIYYDQRGRGHSRGEVRDEDVHVGRYVEDLEALRLRLGLDRFALLGHSWGALLALHYALAHPDALTHLLLLNPASVTYEDFQAMRERRRRMRAPHAAEIAKLDEPYERGDPQAVAAFYAIDFGTTFKRPEDLRRMNLTWTREQILSGRAIEDRLMGALVKPGFSMVAQLNVDAAFQAVIHGELDFFPRESSARIAGAIPAARFVELRDSGHFSYVDAAEGFRAAVDQALRSRR